MAIEIKQGPPAPPPRTTRATTAKKQPEPQITPEEAAAKRINARQQGVAGLGQIGVFITGIFGWKADAGTISMYAPQIGLEAAKLAETNEKLGAQLDRAAEMGPYAALLAIGVQFGVQIAVNHGWMKADKFGSGSAIMAPEQIIAEVETQQALEMAQRAEQLAAAKAQAAQRLQEARARRDAAEQAMNDINLDEYSQESVGV
jgi:hypothetical protein